MFRYIFMISILFPVCVIAQVTGMLIDFNDGDISAWQVPADQPHTFELSAVDSALQITYHRTAESWAWDNFNYTPADLIQFSANPIISLRAKSNISTVLTLKPVYQNDTSDWLQVSLPDDNEWHRCTFALENGGESPMYQMYLYLDGGSTIPTTGTVWLDDVQCGDSVEVKNPVNFIEMEIAMQMANRLLENSVVGDGDGEYPLDAVLDLQSALDEARLLYYDENVTQADADEKVWDLYDACVNFESAVKTKIIPIIDPHATKKTRYLFENLALLMPDHMLFGMQDATGYGVGWTDDDDRSDVKDVCGSYPAIYAWGIRQIAQGNRDDRHRYRIVSAFERGGINSISWHEIDPQGRGFYADDVNNENIVATLLPGGEYHNVYKQKLWNLASYFKSLRGTDGQSIPIIFRPYHENNGSWFWWGHDHCTRTEFIQLWQFTVSYLRDSLNVHNLLYAYSPDSFDDKAGYLARYPGDEYVDIIGHDWYSRGTVNARQIDDLLQDIRDIVEIADERGKISALTETGRETIDVPDWFTTVLLNPIKNDSIARNVAYAAVWRNARLEHFYAPYPGHPSVPDFLAFFDDPFTMFENDLPDVYALQAIDSIPPVFTKLPDPDFVAVDTLVSIEVVTNERAFVRYSAIDQPYDSMPFAFENGQGISRHTTVITGQHGEQYTYYLRARDMSGNTMDRSTAIRFSIDTTQAPIYWNTPKYNDDNWENGIAPVGYGIDAGGTITTRVNTVYLRHTFRVENADQITYCAAIINYDNGVVAYLNGEEIARINVPFGELDYDSEAGSSGNGIKAVALGADQIGLLHNGLNLFAVELHQAAHDTADLWYDMRLITPAPLIEYGDEWRYYDRGDTPPVQSLTSVDNKTANDSPVHCQLFQNYPNPFNPKTQIRYRLPAAAHVELVIFDLLGKQVDVLVNTRQAAGDHQIMFDAMNVASGIYLYRLRVDDRMLTRKMLLVR